MKAAVGDLKGNIGYPQTWGSAGVEGLDDVLRAKPFSHPFFPGLGRRDEFDLEEIVVAQQMHCRGFVSLKFPGEHSAGLI